jgi:hypothetical protein
MSVSPENATNLHWRRVFPCSGSQMRVQALSGPCIGSEQKRFLTQRPGISRHGAAKRISVLRHSARLFVLGALHGEEVFQLPLQRFERRPLHRVLVPALEHDVVQRSRTARRTRHSVAVLHLVQHLGICHACKYAIKKN